MLLLDEKWHITMEINDVNIGGSEGCRRLREIRAQVHAGKRPPYTRIERRCVGMGSTQWEYRLRKDGSWLKHG